MSSTRVANVMQRLCRLAPALSLLLAACVTEPESIVRGPTTVRSLPPEAPVEHVQNGSLFQPGSTMLTLFQDAPKASRIGDKLKIVIAESMSGSSNLNASSKRSNSVTTKGPGTKDESLGGLINNILNLDVSASGEDNFTGTGKSENTNSLKGTLAASVINVLPNGNLVVAGEKSIVFNGANNTLRFSGVVSPRDIKANNIVSSEDVVDARLEHVGRGGVADSVSMTWLQRFLTDGLLVW